MIVQCDKLTKYSAWSGLNVNHKKCSITGILHKEASSGLNGQATCPARLETLLKNKISIGNTHIPYLPPSQPYPYLGVLVSLTLDWTPQLNAAIKASTEAGIKLAQSLASPRQCLHVISTCIKPSLAYAFAAAPYLPMDIARLDRVICGIVKRCCRLPRSFPTAAIHLPQTAGGMGITSLMVDYVQVTTATLTRALNDTGRLGAVTRALIDLQHSRMGDLPTGQMPRNATAHYTAIRQLALLQHAGITIMDGNRGPITPPEHGLWKLHDTHRKLIAANHSVLGPGPDQGITAAMLYPLHQLEIRDITDLIAADGTHLISSQELLNAKGAGQVKRRHMIALNRISLTLSRQPPQGWTGPPHKYPHTNALPLASRSLPTELAQPKAGPTSATLAGTKIISQFCRTDPTPLNGPTTKVTIANTKRKLPTTAQRAAKNDAKYGRNDARIAAHANLDSPELFWNTTWAQLRQTCAKKRCEKMALEQFATAHQLPSKGWEAIRDAIMSPAASMLPAHLVYPLYNSQEVTTAILGRECWKGTNPTNQCNYIVAWQDTVICEEHKLHYETLGYTVGGRAVPAPIEAVPTHLRSANARYIHAQWQPTSEPLTNLQASVPAHTLAAMLASYEQQAHQRLQDPQMQGQQHRDAHLTNLQRQGTWVDPSDIAYNAPLVKLIRKSVTIDPKECNPDADICAPGKYIVQLGARLQGSTPAETMNPDTAYIYNPQGRCIGSLSVDRLQILHARYKQLALTGSAPLQALRAATFEEDLAKLLMRYRQSTAPPTRGTVQDKDQLTTPSDTMHALATLGITAERFASPLNFHPAFPTFYSVFPEDQLFGAELDAYSRVWTGASHAHPAHNHPDMHKAVRWAIASAEACDIHNIPSCTIFTLPQVAGSPYNAHMSHPCVYKLDSIPKRMFQWWDPRFWATAGTPQKKPSTADVAVFAVANRAGYHSFLARNADAFRTTWAAMGGPYISAPAHTLPPYQNNMQNSPMPPPRALHRLLRECQGIPTIPGTVQPVYHLPELIDLQTNYPCTLTLASEPDSSAYTDGSCIKTPEGVHRTGAAVYVHARSGPGRIHHVLPGGVRYTNTINRAELAAIHAALSQTHIYPHDKDLTIYTDSLCSIYNIRKMMNSPGMLRESKHLDLLSNIVNALAVRAQTGACTHIRKVKAHSVTNQCRGNSYADSAAVMVARGKHEPNATTEHSDADPYARMAWPTIPAKDSDTQAACTQPPPPRHATNLSNSIKYAAQPTCGTDSANMSGVYATAWTANAPTLHQPTTAKMWRDPAVSWRQTMLCLKARWGHLWSKKLAHRYRMPYCSRPATNPNCPLCPELDGCGHILGGCKHKAMKGAYISRHDKAVKILHSVLTKKSALGGFFSILDAGKAADLPTEAAGKRLPAWLKPPTTANTAWSQARPDIAFIAGLPCTNADSSCLTESCPAVQNMLANKNQYKIILLEIGFCSDTNHQSKHLAKLDQHRVLVDCLRQDGWTVELHPITLGHCGTVPQTLPNFLASHSVATADITKCINQLHQLAVHTAADIVTSRRALERQTPIACTAGG